MRDGNEGGRAREVREKIHPKGGADRPKEHGDSLPIYSMGREIAVKTLVR